MLNRMLYVREAMRNNEKDVLHRWDLPVDNQVQLKDAIILY